MLHLCLDLATALHRGFAKFDSFARLWYTPQDCIRGIEVIGMADNVFLTAKEMAQDLVRARVEPDQVTALLDHLGEHKEEGIEGFLGYVEQDQVAQPLQETCAKYLGELQDDTDVALDLLGWSVGFMRYYRGEGNRPHPNRRPSEPRRQRSPRAPRRPRGQQQEVTSPIASLKEGQELEGIVRRIMPYGVFVGVGAERDGLVHISELQQGYTGDPTQVVNENDTVTVWVKSVDLDRQRISLTMRGAEAAVAPEPEPQRPQQRQSAPRRRSAGPRRSNRSEPTRLYEDEAPKEMTTLGEALRLALEEKEAGQEEEPAGREKKQDHQSSELAEALRRTLYG